MKLSNGTTATLNKENNWTTTINDLPKYDKSGAEIKYTWTEDAVEGYKLTDTKVEGTTTTFTNKLQSPEKETPKKGTSSTTTSKTTPSTGDGSLVFAIVLAGIALIGGAGVAVARRKLS